jgi:hypothetical protein
VADGVDAAEHPVQPAGPHTALDRFTTEAKGNELPMADDSVLPRGNRRDPGIDSIRLRFRSHTD